MTESLGRPETAAGRKTLPGMAARPVLDVMTAAMVVFSRLALNGSDWMGERTRGKLVQVAAGSAGEELGPADTKCLCLPGGLLVGVVRERDRCLHDLSITGYYLDENRQDDVLSPHSSAADSMRYRH